MYFRDRTHGHIFESDYPQNWPEADYERLTKAEGARLYQEQCRVKLRGMLQPGQTVYTILRKAAPSGMSRNISLVVVDNGKISDITYLTAKATGYSLVEARGDRSIRMGGCGMDMGFALVHSLGAALWPDGTPSPHGTRNGEPDSSGSYALKHEWL